MMLLRLDSVCPSAMLPSLQSFWVGSKLARLATAFGYSG